MRQLSIKSKIRQTHANMMARCYNQTCKSYKAYGDKGIRVYEEWHNLETFRDYCLNNGWFEGCHTARDGDTGNYEPTNIKFITPQANRLEAGIRRGRKIICTSNGKEFYSVKEAARWIKSIGLSEGKIKTIAENIRAKGLKGSTSYGYEWEVVV